MNKSRSFQIIWVRFIGWLLFCVALGWVTGLWAFYLPLMALAFVFGMRRDTASTPADDAAADAPQELRDNDDDRNYATWGLRSTLTEEDEARIERAVKERNR